VKRSLPVDDEMSTITVLGMRQKGVNSDELQGWFQQLPGFSALQLNDRLDGMFVKFTTGREAEDALREAVAQNLPAEWARRNLDENLVSTITAAPAPISIPPVVAAVRTQANPAKRQCIDDNELVTLAVLGIRDKGLVQADLEHWFMQQPGFLALHVNARVDGLFVKFETASLAERALEESNALQLRAEWARRNLDTVGDQPATQPSAPAPPLLARVAAARRGHAVQANEPTTKRTHAAQGDLNTITILGMTGKGLDVEETQKWFQQCPGFMTLKVNDRIDGIFVKFASPADAAQALEDAVAAQIPAEWARRNLD